MLIKITDKAKEQLLAVKQGPSQIMRMPAFFSYFLL